MVQNGAQILWEDQALVQEVAEERGNAWGSALETDTESEYLGKNTLTHLGWYRGDF